MNNLSSIVIVPVRVIAGLVTIFLLSAAGCASVEKKGSEMVNAEHESGVFLAPVSDTGVLKHRFIRWLECYVDSADRAIGWSNSDGIKTFSGIYYMSFAYSSRDDSVRVVLFPLYMPVEHYRELSHYVRFGELAARSSKFPLSPDCGL